MEEVTVNGDTTKAKYVAKASLFTDLFADKRYILELYRKMHPERNDVTIDDIEIISLKNVILNSVYNDLGFRVGNHLFVLVEAQSTWTLNILTRLLMYAVNTYQEYISENDLDLYGTTRLPLPPFELYVLYSGADRAKKPKELSLTRDFFKGQCSDIELTAKVLTGESDGKDVVSQYMRFTDIWNECVKAEGRTIEAARKAVNRCIEENVLREYFLEKGQKEVTRMLMSMFDQETAMRMQLRATAKLGAMEMMVENYRDFGKTVNETSDKLVQKFKLSPEEAADFVAEHWGQ